MTTIVIVNKTGILSELCVKNLKREDLYITSEQLFGVFLGFLGFFVIHL